MAINESPTDVSYEGKLFMQIKNLGTPLAVAALLSVNVFTVVKADESVTTITSTTTSTDVPGSVVYYRTISPTVLLTTIEGRRKDLEKSINDAYASGSISGAQCETMKRELRRIAQETGSNTITYPVAIMLAQDLDYIGQQYRTIVTTTPVYVPIISGSNFTVYTGKTYKLDDFSARRAGLENTITKALYQGRLTDGRAAELRKQLANIGNEANCYLADGSFDAKESRHLYDAFDHVAQEIEKFAGKDKDPV